MEVESVPHSRDLNQIIKILFLLGVLFSCLILLVHQGLPFLDCPNHLSRYYFLTRDFGSPLYNQYYTSNFKIIPNIGVDVLMALIGRVVDASLGLRLLLCGTILSASLGYAKLSLRRNEGRWHPALILIPLTLFSFSMVLGFLNFVLAASILPWAIYLYEKHESLRIRFAVVFVFTMILFFCHLMVAVLLLIMIGSKLLTAPKGKDKLAGFGSILFSMVVMAALLKTSTVSGEGSQIVFSTVVEKFKFFFSCMSFGPWWMVVNGLTYLGFLALILTKNANIDRDDRVLLIVLFAFYLVCPFGFKITANMDGRIPAILFSLFLATARFKPNAESSQVRVVSFGLAAALFANLASIYAVVHRGDQEAKKMRTILSAIPTGDSLFIGDISQWRADHRANWYPAYRMLAYYTAIDRPLFISGMFVYPSQQPIILKPGLEGLGYATRSHEMGASVSQQVNEALDELKPRQLMMKSIGVKQSWFFFVNYESTGYDGISIPGTVYQDKNYLLAHVDN